MARIIAQETFDEVVRENVDVFSMTPEDAVKDAIQQFEAQGVDLSNIVKDSLNNLSSTTTKELRQVLENVTRLQNDRSSEEDLVQALEALQLEVDKSLAHKLFAAKNNGYNIMLDSLDGSDDENLNILLVAARSLTSLMTGQPDLLDARGMHIMFKSLHDTLPSSLHAEVLKWATQCCIRHERNRQDLIALGITENLKRLLQADYTLSPTIQSACELIRTLVLDDDIRVQFGSAHEHAKELANKILRVLVELSKKFDDVDTLNELLMTTSALIVRSEFCSMFKDAGGLQLIVETMEKNFEDKVMVEHCLKLIKVLAGDDDVKSAVVSAGAAPLIVSAMNQHQYSAPVVSQACATIAALTLRSPANSKLFVELNVAGAILDGMLTHSKVLSVQKQGSWAIRNIVSRDRSLSSAFLERNAEEILHEALKKYGSAYDHEYDIKSALRDLGCDVNLKELWTGKGGALN